MYSNIALQKISSMLQLYVKEGKIAGVQALIAQYGSIILFESLGVQNIKTGKPIDVHTIFRIMSMTKPITAAAVLMLVDDQKLLLNDPISKYIPELFNLKVVIDWINTEPVLETVCREITIHDLLTHTAGFSYGYDSSDPIDKLYQQYLWRKLKKSDKEKITLKNFIQCLAKIPLAHQPGTIVRYSVALDILGYLVECVTGVSFEKFLQTRLFNPLGMKDTSFCIPWEKEDRLATIYISNPDKAYSLRDMDRIFSYYYSYPDSLPLGGSGLYSTTMDYFLFSKMLLNKGKINGVNLLSEGMIGKMISNRLGPELHIFGENKELQLGYGLRCYKIPIKTSSSKDMKEIFWGCSGGANTSFWIDFNNHIIGILMMQDLSPHSHQLKRDFKNLVYQTLTSS